MKTIILVLLILIGLAGVYYYYPLMTTPVAEVPTPTPQACTQEAKICPDGSSVGRTGPQCDFAECPTVPSTLAPKVALNQKVSHNGIFITPLEVLSDSRCPSDVVCVTAGEISVRTLLEKGTTTQTVTLTSQSTVVFGTYKVGLSGVTPEKNSTTTLKIADYRFTFLVTPLIPIMSGTISGKVSTSPICPVETTPPQPQCSPKPYATSIRIRETGESTIIKTIESDNSGMFATDLPVGSYELDALTVNNATLPRCTMEVVQVRANQNTARDISCDTGIR